MANAKGFKKIGKPFTQEVDHHVIEFDVTGGDSGATGSLRLCEFTDNVIITGCTCQVETAFTSAGGTDALVIGVEGGDDDAFLAAATGSVILVDNYVVQTAAAQGLLVADGAFIATSLTNEELTGGKLLFHFDVVKAG